MIATRAPLLAALALAALVARSAAPQPQEEGSDPRPQERPAGEERIWEGYLWKDRLGRMRVGQSVIAMGVTSQGGRIVGGPLAERLESLVSGVGGDWFFWNYQWIGNTKDEGLPDTPIDRIPRVSVRLRGVVVVAPAGTPDGPRRIGLEDTDHTMVSGRVMAIEFLSEAWLRAWQAMVKLDFNPYWIWKNGKAIEADPERCRALMEKVVPALLVMRGHSTVTAGERTRARAVDPEADAVNHLRRRMESYAHRWLLRMQEKHGITVDGVEKLGALPPGGDELQRWFCAAADKAAFLAKIRERYDGDLAGLTLSYYAAHGANGVTWSTVRVDRVEGEWSDEDFGRHQALTKKTLDAHR